MKKPLAVIFSLVLALTFALSLAFPAAADDPTPTPTIAPPALMSVELTVGAANHNDTRSGSVQCVTEEGGFYESSTPTWPAYSTLYFVTAGFTCLGEVTFEQTGSFELESDGLILIRVATTAKTYFDSDFQSNGTDVANYEYGPFINGKGETTETISHGGYMKRITPWPNDSGDYPLTSYIFVHDTTKPPCDTEWETADVIATGTIGATGETGVPETLVVGSEYRLTVWGGPWNDGTDPTRRDTAVKVGAAGDWTPLSDFVNSDAAECSQGDPLDPTKVIVVFPATDADFAIRVNDLAGQFADNSGNMSFLLERVQPRNSGGCENQYLQGNLITSGTIPAADVNGVQVNMGTSPYYAGSWIEIDTSGGPWLNDGVPPSHYDVAIKNPDLSWSELTASPYTACSVTVGNYVKVWIQLPNNNGIRLRVNDTAAWTGNTGSMGYTIYSSTFSPNPPGGCAANYTLGDLIKTVQAPGNFEQGVALGDLSSGQDVTGGEEGYVGYFVIETEGIWNNGTPSGNLPSTAAAITYGTTLPATGDFHNLLDYSEATCVVQLDPVGHLRVYIPNSAHTNQYSVRAQDMYGSWDNNSGNLFFKIYEATNLQPPGYIPGDPPGPGTCDAYYTKGAAATTYTLYGSQETWVNLPVLTSGKIYALETADGPWTNDTTPSYEIEISDGTTEWNLVDFTGAACEQSADGNHILMYFQALAGRHYKIRVYDPGGVFTDNTDHIHVIQYDTVVPTLPGGDCSDNYTLTELRVPDNRIPINPSGVTIGDNPTGPSNGFTPGNVYAIMINGTDYWRFLATLTEHRFDSSISSDNGSNWSAFDPDWSMASCAIQMNQPLNTYERQYKIYFTAGTGTIKMRAGSESSPLLASGNLTYTLYGATPVTPGGTPTPPGTGLPPEWEAQCSESYLRPNYLFKMVSFQLPALTFGSLGSITFPVWSVPIPAVDDWIAYLEWSVRSYFAWCPQHTAALQAIPTTMNDYEPFGTINEVNTSFDHLNTLMDQLQTSGGESAPYAPYSVVFDTGGGASGSSGWQGIMPVVSSDSPWAWSGSGPSTYVQPSIPDPFTTTTVTGGEESYIDYCQAIFDAHFGLAVGSAMCFVTNVARGVPLLWILVQLGMDVGSVVGIIAYIQKRWVDPRMSA
jgi:hypothetical protein